MAGALRALNLKPPTGGTPFFRRQIQLPLATRSPFSGDKFNAAHFTWKLRAVARVGSIRASAEYRQGNDDRENRLPQVLNSNWSTRLSKFAADNFLPLGLTLRSDEIGAAAEAWPVGLFGLASILIFTPFFSKIILLLKLQPQEFVTGLAIFSCMPTTLSSGVALTRIPFSVSKFIAAGVGVSVPTERLLRSLVLTLLVPLILGKVARELFKGVASFADGNRKLLAMISAVFLSFVPWIQVSRSRALLLMVKPAIFLVAVTMGALLHAVLLAFNALAIPSLSLMSGGSKSPFAKNENASALLLVASQKTLPVMVAVVEQLGGALGESGLLVLPCVAAHLNQIIIDSFLVSLWKQKEGEFGNAKSA
ncbi:UNVERIFIED_CONTAM: putative sodium/metabolite cotransporter BASS4, chloroplastic [Sesamum indicum]